MNDIRILTQSRKTRVGFPARQSGGTMSKFAYFVEFLCYFLDAPINLLLKDDLNQIRNYSNLKINIGIFNSCSQVNAIQNNKVAFNEAIVKNMIKNSDWRNSKNAHIVVVHHSNKYKINYFDDKYLVFNNKKWINKLQDDRKFYSLFLNTLERYITNFNNFFKIESEEGLEQYKEKYISEYDKFKFNIASKSDLQDFNGFQQTEVYTDMNMLYNILKNEKSKSNDYLVINDYSEEFKNNARRLFTSMEEDRRNTENTFNEILFGTKSLVLAGHEHKNDPDLTNNVIDYNKAESKTFVIDKLFHDGDNNGNKPVNYRIFRITVN